MFGTVIGNANKKKMTNYKMGKAAMTSKYRFSAVGITCISLAIFCIGAELMSTTATLRDSILVRDNSVIDDESIFRSLATQPSLQTIEEYANATASSIEDTTENEEYLWGLPEWIVNYINWHNEMRIKYPGAKLLTDPEAPNLIVRTPGCGGLADRLGQLPLDLYVANQTNRLLLIWWNKPAPLEEFLIPNTLDWRVPDPQGADFENSVRILRRTKPRSATKGILNDCEWREPDWSEKIDQVISRAKPGGELGHVKLLTHRLVGHSTELALEKKLKALGETDLIHFTESFGKIYNIFFRPSPGVQNEIDISMKDMGINPGEKYSAIHLRVRHPRGIANKDVRKKEIFAAKDSSKLNADEGGLQWEGEPKNYALSQATHAIKCTRQILKDQNEKVYFYADSGDLVRHMVDGARQGNITQDRPTEFEAAEAATSLRLVGRDSTESLHLHRQRGEDASHYYDTFVDLMIASKARCVSYGIGNFGLLASKIAGPECSLWYQQEAAGPSPEKGRFSPFCTDDLSIVHRNAVKA